MPPKGRRHKNYKAYVTHQTRVLQVKFPFLTTKQIKAKICSSWDALSPEKKHSWGSSLSTITTNHDRFSSPTTSSKSSYSPQSPFKATSTPKTDTTQSFSARNRKKKVRFQDVISRTEEIEEIEEFSEYVPNEKKNESYEISDVKLNKELVDEFNAIVNHKLDIEIEKIDHDEDEDSSDKEGYKWPLFGDSLKTILPMGDESDEYQVTSQEGDLMCNMFDEPQPHQQSTNKRLLSCNDTSNNNATPTKLFKEDQEFFA